MSETKSDHKFQIFRGKDAVDLADAGCMTVEPFDNPIGEAFANLRASGMAEGDQTQVLFNIPGFSLTYAWFKKDYPLPLHSHNADCLYYIISGSLRLGTETLGARDGFFLPAGVPYTYTPGEQGVEILEFRHATHFNFVNHAKGMAFWDKALETVKARQPEWASAGRPPLNV